MHPTDAFDRILATLHQAALDDAHWPAASALIDEACRAVGSGLVVGEAAAGADRIYFARFLYRGQPRDDLAREYFEAHYPHDPGMRRLMRRPEGRLVHLPELFTADERRASPVYNEGWRGLQARDGLYAHFGDPDGLRMVWGVGDPVDGNGWQHERLRMIERLLPHVRHFVRVRQALAAAGACGASLPGLLDSSRIGVLHLDRTGRIMAANAPATAILRRRDGLLEEDGTLHAALPADSSRLRRLLARALPGVWRDGPSHAPSGGSIALQRISARTRLALHVVPVGGDAADFGARRVAALGLLVDPASRPRINPARVAVMLGLSESESRVAALLAEGRPVRQIAADTGFRENYVRWLIQQIYRKQGVSGQIDLVRRVLAVDAFPPP